MLKKIITSVFLSILFCSAVSAQENSIDSTIKNDCTVNSKKLSHFFHKVEIISQYKGFGEEWFVYAQKNLDFETIIKSLTDSVQVFQDSILVRFVVTQEKEICGVTYVSGNELLFKPVQSLLYESTKWIPAQDGNRFVTAFRDLQVDVLIDKPKQHYEVLRRYHSYFR